MQAGDLFAVDFNDRSECLCSMNAKCTNLALYVFLGLFLLLVGCGGGGGGAPSPPANVPPVADAGQDQFAYTPASSISLSGLASDSDGTIVGEQWTQTSGPAVVLSHATTATANFVPIDETASYGFTYTVTDNDGSQSADQVSVFTSRILFADTFDNNSSLSVWGVLNETGSTATWDVVNGSLYQQNKLETGTLLESYRIGTLAYLDRSAVAASNTFRFSVEITPQSTNKGSDVGVIFPFDIDNSQRYYRLSMSSRDGFTRLEQRNGSDFTTLAVNSIGYRDGETMTVTVEIDTDTIVVLIDNEPVFAKTNLAIFPGTVALYTQEMASFDNLVISENSPQPLVAVASPLAFSIALEPDAGNTLAAKAVTLNSPTDADLVFVLNDGEEYPAELTGSRFSSSIAHVPDGENDITAILRGADGAELARDTNTVVGVGGNYIIAVGDSITNGSRDEDPENNVSLDGRIVATQGFEAPLNDELTVRTDRPHIVFNEGIGGDRSIELAGQRIDSIMERHPRAGTMLLLIGTNDVWDNISVDQFEINVRTIVTAALTDEVDRVFIALIPPFYNANQAVLNSRVATYNTRIQEIIADPADNLFLGPDFFTLFENNYPALYDADGVHPNDAGYQAMANAWADVLEVLP